MHTHTSARAYFSSVFPAKGNTKWFWRVNSISTRKGASSSFVGDIYVLTCSDTFICIYKAKHKKSLGLHNEITF